MDKVKLLFFQMQNYYYKCSPSCNTGKLSLSGYRLYPESESFPCTEKVLIWFVLSHYSVIAVGNQWRAFTFPHLLTLL